ncbi:sulfatase family protein [Chitinophaga nivalis]|uniref:Sulfatase n=1 Tax=Chitinophaga nivalis TaxID=2991709 RepID=A0ABT3IEX5_9BACT|nr:sulfatase [Chitinophaga nivalis]MCW3467975.1 sulfatase [Chitinophaga nivalis]MCW3482334.1 sulfatase [Chitinophaga nivalis]
MKKIVRFTGLLLLTAVSFSFVKPLPPAKRPNVVIIFMDDMGYGDLECYAGTPWHTPHINRMAAQGMRFTYFYVAQAVCSASRAALLTGCYPNRIGIHGALWPTAPMALDTGEQTIAGVLKQQGYHTGMVGKWHLGSKVPWLPLQHGFDEYLGLPYSNDMWPVHYDGKPYADTSTHPRAKYPPLPLIAGNNPVKYIRTLEDQAQLTTMYTERACRFIRENRRQPFFLYLAHSMPHVPIAVSDKHKGKSKDGLFGDVMTEIDWSVGQVMKTLEDNGLAENTLVIFTSDNGPWLNYGNHAGNTGGLREGKGTSWEGGIRVPCIMRWPGKIPAGTVCNKMAATIDLLPTIANLCGAALPVRKIDGVNVSSLLFNNPDITPRDEFAVYYEVNSLQAIRKGPWKLVLPHRSRSYKLNVPGYDGFPGAQPVVPVVQALYDMRRDPGETLDVQQQFPDVVKELLAVAEKYRKDLGDDLTGEKGNGRRKAGEVQK